MKPIFLKWDCPRQEYEQIFKQVEKSNLLQSWNYGDAKQIAEGWAIRRAIIFEGEKALGILQILQKKTIFFFTISRINRGPLLLQSDEPTISAIQRKVKEYFSIFRLRVLVWAPENSLSTLKNRIYHWRKNPWKSAWVNVRRNEAEILASLDGKWRNQLNKARKSGVFIDASDSETDFQWLLELHVKERDEKGFKGLSVGLIGALREAKVLRVLIACIGQTKLGGIVIALHGASATYLIGYNTAEGRKLHANNLLLYHALTVTDEKYDWFDVGGFGTSEGINNFKHGMRGEDYQLFGEYIAI